MKLGAEPDEFKEFVKEMRNMLEDDIIEAIKDEIEFLKDV